MIRALRKIFPLYLTLIVNFPLIIGVLINSDLVSPRWLTINLLWQTIFVMLYQTIKSPALYKVGVAFFGFTSIIETAHWAILKSPLSHSSLFVISATNFQESVEFLGLKAGLYLLLIIPLLYLIYLAWRHKPDFKFTRVVYYTQGVIVLVFLVFVLENVHANRLIRKGIPQFAKVGITFQQEMKLFKEAKQSKSIQYIDAKATDDKQTIILILGESSNRNHWQLYGKDVPTTPRLSKRNDLYVFDNVVSSHSSTIASVLQSLSEAALDNDIKRDEGKDVFDVFKSAGYSTYWISNQSPIGVWENMITILARKSDRPVFVNIASSSSMESTMTRSYDELLFEPTKKVLQEKDSLKFIVIHTMGNHTSYRKRYPSSFNKFKGTNKKEQTIAEYHNTMLYHDYVLDSLLNLIEEHTDNSVVIYVADHGQNVYDEGNTVGHSYAGKLPKANVEIPFIFWFSDEYKKDIDLSLIESKKSDPYVTDNLFHTLIELARIKTPIFKPRSSFVNPDFDKTRKRILEDNKDYDE